MGVSFTMSKQQITIIVMRKPTRIEYEAAFRHVMDRGRISVK
jgi:hypothetical protein